MESVNSMYEMQESNKEDIMQVVLEKYKSKRNQVERVSIGNEQCIRKTMQNNQVLEYEQGILEQLQAAGVDVPRIIRVNKEKRELFLEYIDGTLLLDWFEQCEESYENGSVCEAQQEMTVVIEQWIKWLDSFYQVGQSKEAQRIVCDVNFRNFILQEAGMYGIDFELCKMGTIEEDVAKIAAFGIMYTPEHTLFKKLFVNTFIEKSLAKWGLDDILIHQYYQDELAMIKKRRSASSLIKK